jgi:hypothetical protein
VFHFLAISGGWSSWTSWSTCNPDCVRHRRRTCNNPEPDHGGPYCKGLDHSVDVCTGGMCRGIRLHHEFKSLFTVFMYLWKCSGFFKLSCCQQLRFNTQGYLLYLYLKDTSHRCRAGMHNTSPMAGRIKFF